MIFTWYTPLKFHFYVYLITSNTRSRNNFWWTNCTRHAPAKGKEGTWALCTICWSRSKPGPCRTAWTCYRCGATIGCGPNRIWRHQEQMFGSLALFWCMIFVVSSRWYACRLVIHRHVEMQQNSCSGGPCFTALISVVMGTWTKRRRSTWSNTCYESTETCSRKGLRNSLKGNMYLILPLHPYPSNKWSRPLIYKRNLDREGKVPFTWQLNVPRNRSESSSSMTRVVQMRQWKILWMNLIFLRSWIIQRLQGSMRCFKMLGRTIC